MRTTQISRGGTIEQPLRQNFMLSLPVVLPLFGSERDGVERGSLVATQLNPGLPDPTRGTV